MRPFRAAKLFPLCLAAACGVVPLGEGPDRVRPDVVLITVDTLRRDHLPTYGYGRPTAPHVGELAGTADVFTAAYGHAPATGPALACLMTGLFPVDTTVASNSAGLPAELPTMAEVLRSAGYRTAAVVSNVILVADSGFGQGFEVYDDAFTSRDPGRPIVERPAPATAAAAIEAWRTMGVGPAFLWVHFNDPHGPYLPGTSPFAGDPPGFAGPASLPEGQDETGQDAIPRYQWVAGQTDPRRYIDRYDGEIRQMDDGLGVLLAELRRDRARFARALVVFTADHGEALGEHRHWFAHGHACTDDLLRVPLIVKAPGQTEGAVRDGVVTHADLLPTVAAHLGIVLRSPSRGRSLRGPGKGGPFLAVAGPGESPSPHTAVLAPPWKLLEYPGGGQALMEDRGGPEEIVSDDGVEAKRLHELETSLVTPIVSPVPVARSLEKEQVREMRRLGYLN